MKKLSLYVCENLAPEYREVISSEGYEDVLVQTFPCTCVNRIKLQDLKGVFSEYDCFSTDRLIICGDQCNVSKLNPTQLSAFRILKSNYCLESIANESIIEYIIQKGGYIISLGWLNRWQENINQAGFDQKTARLFYGDLCQELVLFDSGIDAYAASKIEQLAEYLGIPYRIIKFGLDRVRILLKSIVYEWRLQEKSNEFKHTINELRQASAEYSAILNIMEKIALTSSKRDIVDKLLEVCTVVFGAQTCRYLDLADVSNLTQFNEAKLAQSLEDFIANPEKNFSISEDQKQIMIKISHQSEQYGILLLSDFIFPKYVEKYLNLAISISRIAALAFSNAQKYELLVKTKDEITYRSHHDALTGLYNREYFNKALQENLQTPSLAIFICDIDKMKYVNDTFGHIEGDKLICMTANILKNCFRGSDIVARIGGDEYAAIVPNCDLRTAEMLKTRINEEIAKKNENDASQLYKVSISIGYAIRENEITDNQELIHEADKQMYNEKTRKKAPTI